MGTSPKLTPKQDAFCREYLVDLNATQAAIRAGYSARTAHVQGPRLLANVRVAGRVAALQDARAERTNVEADRVLTEIALLSHSDIRHYVIDPSGNLALAPGAPDDAMRAVSSVKRRSRTRTYGELVETTIEVEFRLWDKPASVRMAASHLGLLKTVHEVHDKTLEDLLREAIPDRAGDTPGQ
jgi:phage terminase small subunit